MWLGLASGTVLLELCKGIGTWSGGERISGGRGVIYGVKEWGGGGGRGDAFVVIYSTLQLDLPTSRTFH